MPMLTPRQRLLTALDHRAPDRVPFDLGGTSVSSITLAAYRPLMKHLSLHCDEQPEVRRLSQVVRHPSEELMLRFDAVARGLWLPNGPDVSTEADLTDGTWRDEWAVLRRKPATSYVFDLVGSPLAGDITTRDIERFAWPDPHATGRMRGFRRQAQKLHADGRFAVIATLVPSIVSAAQFLRGFEDWYLDIAGGHAVAEALHERLTNWAIEVARDAVTEIGEYVDIWAFTDDVAQQTGPMISPNAYRRLIKPQHAQIFAFLKQATPQAKLFYHCCGSVAWALDDFIDIGVDIINPVQVSAVGMDTKELKRRWGKQLTFWGGIDTQRVLPFGTPEDVRSEVRRRIDDLAADGGYVVAAVHNIQPEVPPANALALADAVREFGVY